MITTFCPKCHRPYDESLGECPACSRKTAAEQNQAKARKKISLMGKRSHPAPKPPSSSPRRRPPSGTSRRPRRWIQTPR